MSYLSKNQGLRFVQFIVELEELSLKYGVVVKSIGGVTIFDEDTLNTINSIRYSKDPTTENLTYKVYLSKSDVTT